jgi:hypothetical protein
MDKHHAIRVIVADVPLGPTRDEIIIKLLANPRLLKKALKTRLQVLRIRKLIEGRRP